MGGTVSDLNSIRPKEFGTPPARLLSTEDDSTLVRRSAKVSGILHLGIGLVALIFSLVFESAPIQIAPSIRVDIVDLPDYTKSEMKDLQKQITESKIEEKKQAEPKTKPEPETKQVEKKKKISKETVSLKSKKKNREELRSAIDRIKALQKIEESVSSKPIPKKIKGNVLSEGSLIAEGSQNASTDEYGNQLQAKLRQNWNLPIWLSQKKLSAKAVIFLDRYGRAQRVILTKSSGDSQFDEYVKKTIDASQPFGPPPREWVGVAIELGFPL